MLGLLGKIFGSDSVIKKAGDLIDDAFYTDGEQAADKKEMAKSKAAHRIRLMDAYAPFKVAQRFISLGFVFVFLFIMLNGVIGALYGVIPLENVNNARDFADKMWLGEIIIMIVSFYFGGGLVESIKKKPEGK